MKRGARFPKSTGKALMRERSHDPSPRMGCREAEAHALEQWGIDSSTRANKSPKVLGLEHLDMKQLRRISSICEDDVWLRQRILSAWRPTGRTRIFGADLVRT